MEIIRRFIKKIFREKLSEYVYLSYIDFKSQIKKEKFVNFAYYREELRDIIKDRIKNILFIEENFDDYKIYVKRNNISEEYKDESPIILEKYDELILQANSNQ
jgi:hypothetical protein